MTNLRGVRPVFALPFLLIPCLVHAQSIGPKRLVTSLGGGAGALRLTRTAEELAFGPDAAGSMTFRFAYAASRRISFGIHYDRIGTDATPSGIDRVRFTTYLAEVTYRPWQNARTALELYVALGPSVMSMRVRALDLPLRAQNTSAAVGVRTLHMLSGTMGLFLALDHGGSQEMIVQDYNGHTIEHDGAPLRLGWNSQRLNAGLLIRF